MAALAELADALALDAGRTVVDLGAGTGKFTRLLALTGAEVIAVEPVAEMRERLAELLPGIAVTAGTAEATGLPGGCADAVVAAQSWHWFQDGQALDEVERLLETDPSVTQKTVVIKVLPELDVEQRNMNTDPALLARVAEAGGGFSLDANYADVLASHLPEIQRTQTRTEEVGFFTDPSARGTKMAHWVFLAVFAGLLTAEWGIRKAAGLV